MGERSLIERLVAYSPSQIECMAAEFLRSRPDVVSPVATDVELLLENCPSVSLEIMKGLRLHYSVEGCVCKFSGSQTLVVLVDEHIANGASEAAYNVVIAEELAHIQLHPALLHQVKSIEDFIRVRTDPGWQQIERDARLFSAAIRMPPKRIHASAEGVYERVVDQHGFGDAAQVTKHVRNELATTFKVPVPDMHARLQQGPCDIYDRVNGSVLARSLRLITTNERIAVRPKLRQTKMFEENG